MHATNRLVKINEGNVIKLSVFCVILRNEESHNVNNLCDSSSVGMTKPKVVFLA